MRRLFVAAGFPALLVAVASCIDDPTFTFAPSAGGDGGAEDAPTTTTPPASDDMVLVPAATLAAKLTAEPGQPGGVKCTPIPFFITCDAGADGPTRVPAFRLDRHETTVSAYAACVAAGKCTASGKGADCATAADNPVTCVSRAQAAAYCAFAGKRLVRSLEHVAAAAGTAGRTYPWGNEPPTADRLNACGKECRGKNMYSTSDPWVLTAPVGSLANGKTPEGVVDLSGNVAEWVEATASFVRGGSYNEGDQGAVASSASMAMPAEMAVPTVGFRCAHDQ